MLVGEYRKMMDEKDIEKDMNDIEEDTNGNEKDMNGCERTRLWPFKLSVDGKNVDAAPCVSSRIHPVSAEESIASRHQFIICAISRFEGEQFVLVIASLNKHLLDLELYYIQRLQVSGLRKNDKSRTERYPGGRRNAAPLLNRGFTETDRF